MLGQYELETERFTCEECLEECLTRTGLIVHQWKKHEKAIDLSDVHRGLLTEVEDPELLAAMQRSDADFSFLYESKFGEDDSTLTYHQKQAVALHEFVVAEDGLLYCIDLSNMRQRGNDAIPWRLCVPAQLREDILRQVHQGVLSGHPGITKMYEQLRRRVWWPRLMKDIARVVTTCPTCQITKRKPRRVSTEL